MGKNVTRLFADRKDAPYPVAADANGRLLKLFNDHGEALIAALETLLSNHHTPSTYGDALDTAKQLLAKIEHEAQP